MPSANFVGEVASAFADGSNTLSVNWGILPGNRAWTLRSGEASGETQICTGENGEEVALNHPIDVFYETTSSEGWPFIIVEVWDKSEIGARNFVGCGSIWLPMQPGAHVLDVNIWKPALNNGIEMISDALLPTVPDLKALREVMVNPYLRSKLHTTSSGDVRLKMNVTLNGFSSYGVEI
jgi:B9 domain-containing protein 1